MTYIIVSSSFDAQKKYVLNELIPQILGKTLANIAEFEEIDKLPDIHMINNGENSSVGITEIKDLQKQLIYHPYELSSQLGIICYSHNMTTEAQNSFLKTLEEQPETTHYILLTDNEKKLLDTVVSRGNVYYVTATVQSPVETVGQDFLQQDLIYKFEYVERISGTGEDSDQNNWRAFLADLEQLYKTRLEAAIRESDAKTYLSIQKCINLITTARKRIMANTNKRFTLENLLLQLDNVRV